MRRKHRFVTAPSGLTLFVCLFLPAVRTCGTRTTYPYEIPAVCPPYVLGLLVAIAALLAGTWLTASVRLLRAAVFITGLMLAFASIAAAPYGLLLLGPSGILIAAAAAGASNERTAMRSTLATGALAIAWFGLFVFDRDSLYGVQLSFVASIGLLLGGLCWRHELSDDVDLAEYEDSEPEVTEAELPVARTVSDGGGRASTGGARS